MLRAIRGAAAGNSIDPIGDEMRPCAEGMTQMVMPRRCSTEASGHSSSLYSRSATMPRGRGGNQFAQRQHLVRVERHADRGSRISGQHLSPFAIPACWSPSKWLFTSITRRHPASNEVAGRSPSDIIRSDVFLNLTLELGRGLASSAPEPSVRQPSEFVVMHHRLAIEVSWMSHSMVKLSSTAARGRRHVLHDTARGVMQAAMGHRPRGQPVRRTHARQETSNTPSTSTAASAGREATPTVVREWRPFSPKAATIRSEAPLSTFGPSR